MDHSQPDTRWCALGLLALLALPAGVVTAEGPDLDGDAAPASALVALANQERAKAGIPALRPDARLTAAAVTQARQAAEQRRIAHVLPDALYPRPEDRLDATGYPWRAWAENLAFGQRTAADAVRAWMESPSHRQNLLNPAYTELGTGVATDATGRPYYVQVFGRPMSVQRADGTAYRSGPAPGQTVGASESR